MGMDNDRRKDFRDKLKKEISGPLRYFVVYKPFNMLCQFTKDGEYPTLADLEIKLPKDVYPLGRLDTDSEGLLILSNDKKLNHLLLEPSMKHKRTYYAQVEGTPAEDKLKELCDGVVININGENYKTQPCTAKQIDEPALSERNPPIRYRKNVPATWIELTLTEGKNRQVRKMTAKVGYPTLRLVRTSIEDLTLANMEPGEVIEFDKKKLYSLLKIKG